MTQIPIEEFNTVKHSLAALALPGILSVGLLACSDTASQPNIQITRSPAGRDAAEPYLFTDPAGTVHLSWIEKQDNTAFLKLSHWESERWTEPVTVASGTGWFVNWADYPSVVSNGKGQFVAHVLEYSAPGTYTYDVKIITSPDGSAWSASAVLHDDGEKAEHGFVSMVPWGEEVLVSWLDGRNTTHPKETSPDTTGAHQAPSGAMTLRAAVLDYAGNKMQEWELDDGVCDCCQTSAAVTDQGPVVVYRNRTKSEVRDIAIVRWVNGSWTEPRAIHNDHWTIDGCPVNGPRSEALGHSLAVAWFTMASGKPVVKVAFSLDAGATFGEPVVVSGAEATGRVDLVLLDERTALVSWMEGASIRVAKVRADGTQEPGLILGHSSVERSSGFPQLAVSGSTVVFAWTDDEAHTIVTAMATIAGDSQAL
jgi:hypothetical protein